MNAKENHPSTHLIQFTVANYRSIREPITLSMVASPKHEERDVFYSTTAKKFILKNAIVLGANASGKSNIFRALFLMRRFTIDRLDMFAQQEFIKPFALDKTSREKKYLI
jgi:AAA15 family ATPase/GTPase